MAFFFFIWLQKVKHHKLNTSLIELQRIQKKERKQEKEGEKMVQLQVT